MRSFHRNLAAGILLLIFILFPMPAFSASTVVDVTVDDALTDYDALIRNNLVFMSARDLAKTFDATLTYDSEAKTVSIRSGLRTATMTVGSTTMKWGFSHVTLDAAPMLIDDTCYVPVKVANTIWGASYGFNEEMLYLHRDGSEVIVPAIEKYQVESASVTIDNKPLTVHYIAIPVSAEMTPYLAVAQNVIGETEALESIAKRTSAKVAINGSYYQTYDASKAKDPFGILIKNGTLIHSESTGSTIGFTADGTVKMDIVRAAITAKAGNRSYAVSLMNHTPSANADGIVLFTNAYGTSLNQHGVSVVVQNGEIVDISENQEIMIPANGFVLLFTGEKEALAADLQLKDQASYQVQFTNASGSPVNWSDVQTAVGAGPMLLKNGSVVVNPEKEGFSSSSDFSVAINRSAIGVQDDGTILLVSGVKCTLAQMADIMTTLGARNAICLDCGAAAGMYASSTDVPSPSKEVSNALIFK